MVESTTSLKIDALEYAFVTSLEYAFQDLFPLHTKVGSKAAGIDMLLTPAVKLINIDTKESMSPDYQILLKDFPQEIDRLVNDYER